MSDTSKLRVHQIEDDVHTLFKDNFSFDFYDVPFKTDKEAFSQLPKAMKEEQLREFDNQAGLLFPKEGEPGPNDNPLTINEVEQIPDPLSRYSRNQIDLIQQANANFRKELNKYNSLSAEDTLSEIADSLRATKAI